MCFFSQETEAALAPSSSMTTLSLLLSMFVSWTVNVCIMDCQCLYHHGLYCIKFYHVVNVCIMDRPANIYCTQHSDRNDHSIKDTITQPFRRSFVWLFSTVCFQVWPKMNRGGAGSTLISFSSLLQMEAPMGLMVNNCSLASYFPTTFFLQVEVAVVLSPPRCS